MTVPTYMTANGYRSLTSFGEDEIFIRENAHRITTIAESENPEAYYSFDNYVLLKVDGEDLYYVTNASGCSCPSEEDVWYVIMSGTEDDIREYLNINHNNKDAAFSQFVYECQQGGFDVGRVVKPYTGMKYDW